MVLTLREWWCGMGSCHTEGSSTHLSFVSETIYVTQATATTSPDRLTIALSLWTLWCISQVIGDGASSHFVISVNDKAPTPSWCDSPVAECARLGYDTRVSFLGLVSLGFFVSRFV